MGTGKAFRETPLHLLGSPVLSSSFSFSHLVLSFSFALSFYVSLPRLHSLSFSLPISLFFVSSCLPFHFLLSFSPPTPLHFATNMYKVSILCPALWRALKKEQHLQWPLGAPRAWGRSKKEAIAIQFQVVRWVHLNRHLIQAATQESDVKLTPKRWVCSRPAKGWRRDREGLGWYMFQIQEKTWHLWGIVRVWAAMRGCVGCVLHKGIASRSRAERYPGTWTCFSEWVSSVWPLYWLMGMSCQFLLLLLISMVHWQKIGLGTVKQELKQKHPSLCPCSGMLHDILRLCSVWGLQYLTKSGISFSCSSRKSSLPLGWAA